MLASLPYPSQNRRAGALLAALLAASPAHGADLGQTGDFDIRWDTTLGDTLAFRTEPANPALLANVNGNDGDRAFAPGLVSSRLDLFTALSAARGDFGINLSAQGWYDPVYFQGTAPHTPASFNPVGVSTTQFPQATRRLMGEDAELLDAFAKDRFDIAGMPVSIRLGRQTLLWGESLFFANNGIAAGQAPVDDIKALTAPLAEARALYLPVTQAEVRVALSPNLSLEAYDQFEWRGDRLPGVDSYFSTTDILEQGGDRVLLPYGYALYRTGDATPHGIGQGGVALRLQTGDADYGLYALRYDAKLPEAVYDSVNYTYHLVFPSGIDMLGASASTYLGDSNVAGEISARHAMPLEAGSAGLNAQAGGAGGGAYAAAVLPGVFASPIRVALPGGYATGDTWHAQSSIVSQLPPSRWWQGASLAAECAANDLIEVTGGHAFVADHRTHFAASLRVVFTPSYFRVLPNLDVSFPLGLGYTPVGRSSINGSENAGGGQVTVSALSVYRSVWQASLAFTHYIGAASAQVLADRDMATLSISRGF